MSTSEWKELKLGDAIEINPKTHGVNKNSPFIEMADVAPWGTWATSSGVKGERGGIKAMGGDTLMARITPCLENGKIAKVPTSFHEVGGSTEFIVLRDKEKTIQGFSFYLCQSDNVHHESIRLMVGTSGRQRVSATDVGNISILLPPLPVQQRIVTVMQSVDDHIANMNTYVSSLEALRTNTLNSLLSGEESEDWEEVKLGEVVDLEKSTGIPKKDDAYIALEHIESNRFTINSIGNGGDFKSKSGIFRKNDILFSKLRPYLHKVWRAEFDGYCTGEVLIYRSSQENRVSNDFLFEILRSNALLNYVDKLSYGTKMPRTSHSQVSDYIVHLPPLSEQERIVNIMSNIDDSLNSAREEVKALREMRTNVLNALLSGEHEIPESLDNIITTTVQ